MSKIISDPLFAALAEWGIDTASVRRVVIDIKSSEPPVIHVEQWGDERLLSVVRALGGVEIKREGE